MNDVIIDDEVLDALIDMGIELPEGYEHYNKPSPVSAVDHQPEELEIKDDYKITSEKISIKSPCFVISTCGGNKHTAKCQTDTISTSGMYFTSHDLFDSPSAGALRIDLTICGERCSLIFKGKIISRIAAGETYRYLFGFSGDNEYAIFMLNEYIQGIAASK